MEFTALAFFQGFFQALAPLAVAPVLPADDPKVQRELAFFDKVKNRLRRCACVWGVCLGSRLCLRARVCVHVAVTFCPFVFASFSLEANSKGCNPPPGVQRLWNVK